MYYIVVGSDIVDQGTRRPSHEELQQWANDCDDEAWVIVGEHAGMTAYPEESDEDDE